MELILILDDVWMKVIQMCAYKRDISRVFRLKQVCKRWEKIFPSAIVEATILKNESLQQYGFELNLCYLFS